MHIPVLKREVIKYLDPKTNQNFIDATFGFGGHSKAILERNRPRGKVLALEADSEIIESSQAGERLILVNSSYTKLKEAVKQYQFERIEGILFDLGLNSWHLEKSGRGFSFKKEEPLDMRYQKEINPLTAEEIVNRWGEGKIKKILKDFGEEKFAGKIAKIITEERKKRPIKNTFQLVEIIRRSIPRRSQKEKHPARRTFQALRIAVNNELDNLKEGLNQSLRVLEKKGKLVVISFHSLEDRIVKKFFEENKEQLKILTKKPIIPSKKEVQENPRARSAKLRTALKI